MTATRFMALPVAMLAGRGAQLQTVNVPVPVPHVEIPARRLMPTEALASIGSPGRHRAGRLEEPERREAYEPVLVAAIQACAVPQ